MVKKMRGLILMLASATFICPFADLMRQSLPIRRHLTVFKSTKGESHPSLASVFIRLADLYNKTGNLRESKFYSENAFRIYSKQVPGTTPEEIAGGLTEAEEALKLLEMAMKLLEDTHGNISTIARIEAQMGRMFYLVGRYGEVRSSFESAMAKLHASGESKSAFFFGIVLNQMGLANVQLYRIDEAIG
ncbi:kinesin light chain 4 [Gossypium australe]|uniref:Kinesin light chain 4 n=1 Tax=Gossypium australe TaxID=47621 RepID=A0A5B6W268_9ROSI|nr:kinesin light chain 4 [Gossypium australe]